MALTLYFHPLSSFCQKALIALYENGTPFTPHKVDLMDEKESAAFKQLWPVGKFPVLRDEKNGKTIPESTSIIEYLAQHYPGPVQLVPKDPDAALTVRALDRFYDLNVHLLTQKVITDRLRPAGQNDTFGVEHARALLQTALRIVDKDMARKTWATGDTFTMADCAAAPSLFYTNRAVTPLAGTFDNVAAYLDRLVKRPSYARALKEAEPFLKYVPM
ncbi:MAG TPA: glutathione S-transferase family protein [Pseudolabrys sp.]|jgi:glutathione S-transferase|nr:glutathione S-transferase family protein [Pseudolabrys sp.]